MKKQRHWLDFAEYASLVGLGVGSVASFVSSQVLYTSAPLSLLVLLNLANRRRFEVVTGENTTIALTDLEHKLSKNIELLNQQVLSLPTVEDVASVKNNLLRKDKDNIDTLLAEISAIQKEVAERFAMLDRLQLNSVRQDVTHIQEQYSQLNDAVAQCNVQLSQLSSSPRLNEVEGAIARLKANALQLRDNLQILADQTRPALNALQDQVNLLNRQFQKMPPPFDATALRQEVTELIRVVSDLVPKREWHNLQGEIRALQQQQEVRNQSEEVLRRKLQELNQQIQVRPVKANLTSLQNQINHLNRQIQKLPPPFDSTSLKREIAQLVKAVGDLVPKRDWSALTTQIKALQKQQEFQQQFETTLQKELQELNEQLEMLSSVSASNPSAMSTLVSMTDEAIASTQDSEAIAPQPSVDLQPQVEFQERIETVLNRELQAIDQQLREMPTGSQLQAQIEATVERELQDINEQLQAFPEGPHYKLVFDFKSGQSKSLQSLAASSTRAALETALEVTQERLVLILPWSSQCSLDDRLLHQLEAFLQRGRQLDIGWCHQANRDEERFLSVINHRWSINPIQKELQATLQQLLHLKRTYSNHFQFKVLGTSGNFLVSDQAFAIMGIDEALVSTHSLPDMELKLWTDDAEVIQGCTNQFDHPVPNPNDITTYWNQAVTRYDLSDRQGAITDFNQVLTINPQDAIAYSYRGLIQYDVGNAAGAIADFSRSLDLNPHQVAAYCNRGFIRSEQGDQLGAISDFSLAIERQPTSAIAHFYRGIADQKYNDSLAAASDFGEAIRLMPEAPMAYYYRGQAYQKLENLRGAIADFETAAHLFNERGNTTNAEKALRSAAKLKRMTHQSNGTAQPRAAQPHTPQSKRPQPSAAQLSVTQPTVTQPNAVQSSTPQPNVTQPNVTQPTVTQPSAAQPKVTQPTVTQPSAAQPKVTQPTVTQPSAAQPKVTQPSAVQSSTPQPNVALPESQQPPTSVESIPQTTSKTAPLEEHNVPGDIHPMANLSIANIQPIVDEASPMTNGHKDSSTGAIAEPRDEASGEELHPSKTTATPLLVEPVSIKSVFVEPVFVKPVFVEPVISAEVAEAATPCGYLFEIAQPKPTKSTVLTVAIDDDDDKTEILEPPNTFVPPVSAVSPARLTSDPEKDPEFPFTVDDFFHPQTEALQPISNGVIASIVSNEASIAIVNTSTDLENGIESETDFLSNFAVHLDDPSREVPTYQGIETLSSLFLDVAPKTEGTRNGKAPSAIAREATKGDRTVDETLDDFGGRF